MKAVIQGIEVEGTPKEIYDFNDFYQEKKDIQDTPKYAKGGYVGEEVNIELGASTLVNGGIVINKGITQVGEN